MTRVWQHARRPADSSVRAEGQGGKTGGRATWRALGVAVCTGIAVLCAACSNGAAPSASAGSSTTTTAAARPTQVAVFGDSLAWETQPYYDRLIHADKDIPHTYDTFGGTAICDWLDRMREVEAQYHPQAVELEFSGNNLTPCMKGYELYTAPYYAKYCTDTLAAINIFAPGGAHVYLIGAPITKKQLSVPNWQTLNLQYAAIAAANPKHVTYINAGRAVEGPKGTFTETLPCLAGQPCTGPTVNGVRTNVVRSTDGTHFCPAKEGDIHGVVDRCTVYSSGAYRFASAMVNAVAPKSHP